LNLPRIEGVIHIVMDAIHPNTVRTAIFILRAPLGFRLLLRCITDRIAITGAAVSLEDMDQPEPMPNLMDCRSSQVEVCDLTTRYGISQDAAPVRGEPCIGRDEISGKLAIAKYAIGNVG